MAVAAEAEQTYSPEQATEYETYARSTRMLQALGRAATSPFIEAAEREGIFKESWRNFVSATEENLATDDEYGEELDFEPLRSYPITSGHVTDQTGVPVVDLVGGGYEASCRAAESDPNMAVQVERDAGDVEVARIVDTLEVGEVYAVVSVEPKKALQQNPAYWRSKGYREGMAVAQIYYRKDRGTMLAGAYSIKQSDLGTLRQIFERRGTVIPENESENRWIRHGIRQQVSLEEAERFGQTLQKEHQQATGQCQSASLTEFLSRHEDTLLRYFHGYIVPLGIARDTAKRTDEIAGLSQALLKQSHSFEPAEIHRLMRIANTTAFSAEDTRFMEEKIRYAMDEELRQHLPTFIASMQDNIQAHKRPDIDSRHGGGFIVIPPEMLVMMHEQLSENIAVGVLAGRSYGGCTPAGKESTSRQSSEESAADSQDVFGGKVDKDKHGSLTFTCPKKGCFNKREPGKLIKHCQKCGADVTCKP